MQALFALWVCLISAYLLSELAKKIGLPRVVGHMAAGLVLGIGIIKSQIFDAESVIALSFLSKLGIILLFYYVGLETNFKAFAKNLKKSLFVSVFNTGLPLIAGFLVMKYFFGFSNLASLIVGICLSVSAQSVSLDILEELKILRTKLGSLIVSTGAVDDTIELLLTAGLLSIFHSAVSKLTLPRLAADVVIFVILILLMRLVFLPYTLKAFGKEKSSTALFMGSMLVVLLIASLAEFLGLGLLIGAMVAGMMVRQTIFKEVSVPNWEEHDMARSIHILAFGFLIPLFFVSVGLNADLGAVMPNLGLIGLLVLIATLGTVGGTILGTMLSRGSFMEGNLLGWGLNPKGDVELVIIFLALQYAIISQRIFTVLVMMSLITTIISPVIFKQLLLAYKKNKMPL